MSGSLGLVYRRIHDAMCGTHPNLRPWHSQWLAAIYLYRDLRRALSGLRGRVLDVGCGDKPYASWIRSTEHVGMDVQDGPGVDCVVPPGASWPFEAGSFDAVICTQVLEHVADLRGTLCEIQRVLKPGGTLVATVPFAYQEHGLPHDYRRFTANGLAAMLERDYDHLDIRRQGAIGSTLGLLLLNWLNAELNRWRLTRFVRATLLPLWILFCAAVNVVAFGLDRLDTTSRFYNNLVVVATKKARVLRPDEGNLDIRHGSEVTPRSQLANVQCSGV